MSYTVRPKELTNVSALSTEARYRYLIYKVADFEEVWSIRDNGGWACPIDDTGTKCIPIWPAQAFAQQCCVDDWQSKHPESISLSDWLKKWLPGMSRDGMNITVFPVPPITETLTAIVVQPDRMAEDLREALGQFGDDEDE